MSKPVFGSKYALEAIAFMAQQERFFGGQVAAATGCQANQIGELLKRFERGGLIEPLPDEPGQLRKYYRRLPSPVWDCCTTLVVSALDEPESDVARLPRRR